MLLPCPYCGPRNVSEFHYAGELSERPDPNATGIGEWRAYLYLRNNPAGWTIETWYHRAGCRQHFVVERHTVTNEVRASKVFPYSPERTDRESASRNAARGGEGAIS